MIEKYVDDIKNILDKIKKEDKDNIDTLIDLETSTELCVGGQLCRYGEIYKLVFYSTDFDDIIYKLEALYWTSKYEGYEDDIQKIQNMFIKGIKEGKDFELGVKSEVLNIIEHEYIFDRILKCL